MRPPASASKNHTHGVEKLEPNRYYNFWSWEIGPELTSRARHRKVMSEIGGSTDVTRTSLFGSE